MKTLLYVDATPDNSAPREIMQCVAKSYGYQFEVRTFHNKAQFEAEIKAFSQPIDVLYLAAHGCKDGISLDDRDGVPSAFLEWPELALTICESQGLNQNSTVFLGCCDGGFKRAALILMAGCPTIDIVAGLPCKLEIQREGLAFHTFVDHVRRQSDSGRISNAVTAAIDQQFNIFVRHEMDVEISQFRYFCQDLWLTRAEQEKQATEAA